MNSIYKLYFLIFLFIISLSTKAQLVEPVKWRYKIEKTNDTIATIQITAKIAPEWHLYSSYFEGEDGPIKLKFLFKPSDNFLLIDSILEISKPKYMYDKIFDMRVGYFDKKAILKQRIKILTQENFSIDGEIEAQGCFEGGCALVGEAFSLSFKNRKTVGGQQQSSIDTKDLTITNSDSGEKQSMWLFILISALAGLLAILTPCVFPMIPMTVSFFLRSSENQRKAIKTAIFFGLSIMLIYTLLGLLFSVGVFGANVGSLLSTHWIPNLLFFLLFLVFAVSFFGAFELVLPGSLASRADAKAEKGGLLGAFFMALTTVIVSFSCTGPFIGALIIEAVQIGGWQPLIGMFFFGLAFSIPFTLLAVFPSALKKIPKSGGWLNAIKVVFAFILLAFGMKFLSNIDQVYGLNLLSREIFLSVWIILFVLLGLYFIGKLKFSHDSELSHISVGRLFLAIITFTFAGYLFTGLLGAPLTAISSLIPPKSNYSYSYAIDRSSVPSHKQISTLCGPAKYADKLHTPHELPGYFDYRQGLTCAKKQGKPAFVVFKGHACANCKKMENTVWAKPDVQQILAEKYVVIVLYTDDRTTLPEDEWITSSVDGKIKKTMGKKNLDIQIAKYQTNTIPFHVIIKPDGTEYKMATTFDDDEFRAFVKKGL